MRCFIALMIVDSFKPLWRLSDSCELMYHTVEGSLIGEFQPDCCHLSAIVILSVPHLLLHLCRYSFIFVSFFLDSGFCGWEKGQGVKVMRSHSSYSDSGRTTPLPTTLSPDENGALVKVVR